VQIQVTILHPEERAPQVPEDTKKVPLEMRVKGFLQDEVAEIGATVTIKTMTGRLVTGNLWQSPKIRVRLGEPCS